MVQINLTYKIVIVIVILIGFTNANICNNTIVNVIVDPTKPTGNNYTCGETGTFNSMTDAVLYFNTIRAIQEPNSTNLIYQQLNIKLVDGDHDYENIQNLVQFNLTIAPFTSSSKNVNVYLGSDKNDILYIEPNYPASATPQEKLATLTNILISNINFKNFKQGIFMSLARGSRINLTFDYCTFSSMNSSDSDASSSQLLGDSTNTNTNIVTFSNCVFNSIAYSAPQNGRFISVTNSQLILKNVEFSSISGIDQLLDVSYNSKLFIESSTFNFISSNTTKSRPLIWVSTSSLNILNTIFSNNKISTTKAQILQIDSSNAVISGSNFTNNYGLVKLGGGVIYASNSTLSISKSYFSSKDAPSDQIGSIVTSSSSNVTFNQCSFDVSDKNAYSCQGGSLIFTNSINLDPSIHCYNCKYASVDDVQYCTKEPSSSTSLIFNSLSSYYALIMVLSILYVVQL